MSSIRYAALQHDRTLHHPKLPQNDPIEKGDDILPAEMKRSRPKHSFVVCADTQFGMTTFNRGWEAELSYSRQAIKMINELEPRPLFCCACGDLVDMERSFWEGKGFTGEECESIQGEQRRDFKEMWESLHEDIALVCLCGNHGTFLFLGGREIKLGNLCFIHLLKRVLMDLSLSNHFLCYVTHRYRKSSNKDIHWTFCQCFW